MVSRKQKYIIIGTLCLVVVCLSIGYAVLSASLKIEGSAKVESKWDVVFLTEEIETTKTGTAECNIGKVTGTSIEGMSVVFNKPGDACTFTVPVKNIGNIPAKLVDVTGKSSNLTFLGESADQDILRNNVTYEVNYGKTPIKSTTDFSSIPILNKSATETVTLKATFLNSSTEMPAGEVIIGGLDRAFIYESVVEGDDSSTVTPVVDNIPDPPELNGDMIPVYYEATSDITGTWKKADVNNENNNWYDYSNQKWANAVTVTGTKRNYYKNEAPVGTDISMDDINTMWVWIPRYSYTIKSENGTEYYGKASFGNEKPTQALPGEIDVKFISKVTETGSAQYTGDIPTNWRTNEAFDFGGEKKSGIWVGKFETTGSLSSNGQACVNETCDVSNITIKPGVASLRNQSVSSFFYAARSMQLHDTNMFGFAEEKGDLHMMKNDEWGAVAYLSQSKFGKYGNSNYKGKYKEIYQNKSSDFISGSSSGTISQSDTISTLYAYNDMTNLGDGQGQAGPGASTTGNIYGIYDMSGGTWEHVMGVLAYYEEPYPPLSGNTTVSNSGFSGKIYQNNTYVEFKNNVPISFPEEKYYNLYKVSITKENMPTNSFLTNSNKACNEWTCYGQALSETLGWYGDHTGFSYRSQPWLLRSGYYDYDSDAGIFGSGATPGNTYTYGGSRFVLTP